MSRNLVLVDSSVWIDAARSGTDAPSTGELVTLLGQGRAAMAWPVWVELYQGARGRREEESLDRWRRTCVWLDFDDDCWLIAARTARACRHAGVNVPLGDLLVHACADRHGVGLLERDHHFAKIREATRA